MGISTNGKRKAASDLRFRCISISCPQRAACQYRFLRRVKSDRAKFLPVADELVLCEDLVYGHFTLLDSLAHLYKPAAKNRRERTSRRVSSGTPNNFAISLLPR
jgi:hypothetical protein